MIWIAIIFAIWFLYLYFDISFDYTEDFFIIWYTLDGVTREKILIKK